MGGRFEHKSGALFFQREDEKLLIQGWGKGLRVRATRHSGFTGNEWALLNRAVAAGVEITHDGAVIRNHGTTAKVDARGKITFYDRSGKLLLEEYSRKMENPGEAHSPLNIAAREYKGQPGGDFQINVRFESDPDEKLYGMGQYQFPMLDVKGCILELAQRNSQVSVPFAVSGNGYGFLWNNPAVGQASFGKNVTEWLARSSKEIDYWITAGGAPAEICEAYAGATGTAPMMPDYAMGFWQCKLRYQTQGELLAVAREYKRRGLPISVIVADFCHWPNQGDWKFDGRYWPDPGAMVRELDEMGIKLMVSIWPTVEGKSDNFDEMKDRGFLVSAERGEQVTMQFFNNTRFFDATNPAAREFVWDKAKKNYYDLGIRIFWLDVAEPEYGTYDFDHFRYHLGPSLSVSNIYPMKYAECFYDGMVKEGQGEVINLIRSAWAGSQRYGALLWSGDIYSSFKSLRCQLVAGMNAGLAGIPWWNADIGGFQGAEAKDPAFIELLVRWFQFAAFTPVMRLHGFRLPIADPLGADGGGICPSGADNEVWSYGEEAYEIFVKYIKMRERMLPYIRRQMQAAHEKGAPVMRPLFYNFPEDGKCWAIDDQFMFGGDILVAPILDAGQEGREVYLPEGARWTNPAGETLDGGQYIACPAPIDTIPVWFREDADIFE